MKYPMGIVKKNKKQINYSNRGMSLESDLNLSNEYYRENDIAIIYKKPTPITIAKVDYPSRKEAIIKEAYFKTPSTTDYNGIYKGKYIDFEAKETKKDCFPLSNIHKHQIEHIDKIIRHNGIAFLIVRFSNKNKTYVLEGKKLLDYINNNDTKSISFDYFLNNGYLITEKINPRLEYLKIINEIYFEGESI